MKYLLALKRTLSLSFLFAVLLFSPYPGGCIAQEAYQGLRPKNNVFVYDYANILGEQNQRRINTALVNFKDTTSNVIVVVTHPDFFGEEPWRFATDLGHAWGVSREGVDNGIVLVVKPKVGNQRGQTHIAVGYGLEGAIPDAIAKRIVENEMIPRFRLNDYSGGVEAALTVLMGLAAGEITEYVGGSGSNKGQDGLFALFFVLFFFAIVFGSMAMKTQRYARMNNIGFWAAWMLLAEANRTHRGSYGTFVGGGRGSGGFGGGGGFGGFGGGGFGGGGAGGSW